MALRSGIGVLSSTLPGGIWILPGGESAPRSFGDEYVNGPWCLRHEPPLASSMRDVAKGVGLDFEAVICDTQDDDYPPGPTGIDEQRIMEALLRLEEVGIELRWSTVLRVLADLIARREQSDAPGSRVGGGIVPRNPSTDTPDDEPKGEG